MTIKFAVLWVAPEAGDPETTTVEERDKLMAGYLQGVLGGYFEVFTLQDGSAMYLSEDGKQRNLRPNEQATRLARELGHLDPRDYIVGSAVVVGAADRDGDDTSLKGPVLEWVLATIQP